MSQAPYMPLFVDAYLADTTHLTAEESGTYLHLLMAMWRHGGSVPNDDRDLARIARVSPSGWPRVKARVIPLLTLNPDGRLSQKRLTKEWARVSSISEANRRNALSGWTRRSSNNNGISAAAASHSHQPNGFPLTREASKPSYGKDLYLPTPLNVPFDAQRLFAGTYPPGKPPPENETAAKPLPRRRA